MLIPKWWMKIAESSERNAKTPRDRELKILFLFTIQIWAWNNIVENAIVVVVDDRRGSQHKC
jgi:hypothetical protein